jgi:hypothetical protein
VSSAWMPLPNDQSSPLSQNPFSNSSSHPGRRITMRKSFLPPTQMWCPKKWPGGAADGSHGLDRREVGRLEKAMIWRWGMIRAKRQWGSTKWTPQTRAMRFQ